VDRWISRQGMIVEDARGPVVEFHNGCSEAAAAGCGACGRSSARRLPASLLDLRSAVPGDVVTLRVRSAALDRVAAACFAGPLVALLAGGAAGHWLGATAGVDADLASGGLGLSLLVLALAAVVSNGDALLRLLELDSGRPLGAPERSQVQE